ncbi:MAG: hypothetical protein JWN14_3009 [Chthonomonadales bacterium]|nr:hypothetical protein [Chthonomonadales bacterium]
MDHELLETLESEEGTECVCRCGWKSGIKPVRALATGGWYLHFRAATHTTEAEAATLIAAMLRRRNVKPSTSVKRANVAELSAYLEMQAPDSLPH